MQLRSPRHRLNNPCTGISAQRRPVSFVRVALLRRSFVPQLLATIHVDVRSDDEAAANKQEAPPVAMLPIPEETLQASAALANTIKGQLILAPLTKGGNLPFRRLCADYGANVTMSEMAFAKMLVKGDKVERARMYKAANETCFGVQIATKVITEGVAAAKLAAQAGAQWLDLNCGCPIYETTRRGLGAELLKRPAKLARLVNGIAAESPIPVTVKIRSGYNDKSINAPRVVELLQAAGAAAVTVHGRTREQRYRKPADWELISQVASTATVPIIGNGDVLTHYEARERLGNHGCHAVMVGRGALIKPWLFLEHKQDAELELTTRDRIGVYRKLASHMREHFGADDWGRRKAFYFFPWHFNFFSRYRSLPERLYLQASREQALISVRRDVYETAFGKTLHSLPDVKWLMLYEHGSQKLVDTIQLGETLDSLPIVERLLRCENEGAYAEVASAIWDASSDDNAFTALERLAEGSLRAWEDEVKGRDREDAAAEG